SKLCRRSTASSTASRDPFDYAPTASRGRQGRPLRQATGHRKNLGTGNRLRETQGLPATALKVERLRDDGTLISNQLNQDKSKPLVTLAVYCLVLFSVVADLGASTVAPAAEALSCAAVWASM